MNATKLIATIVTAASVIGVTGLAYAEIKQEANPSRQEGKDVEATGSMRAKMPRAATPAPTPAPAAAVTQTYTAPAAPMAATPAPAPMPAKTYSEPMPQADRN